MESYLIIVIILLVLAVIDLVVGVSNDAVNFLNSAVGSRVASFRTILIVASLGVLVGSLFSSGMMEIARNGIFNPSFFTFDRVMIVFLAVMLTDVIMLDFYNSLGLPTSTTVSLIFELLGSAIVVGLLIAFERGLGIDHWREIINYSSAITIIFGIFLSVFLSFIVGSIIQHVSRLLFTFNFQENLRKYGALFSGISITIIVYFLLIKGAKGSSFISDDQIKWIMENTWIIVLGSMIFFSISIQVLMWWLNINPLKFIVLLGTFSLAMAFAGNDMVNFIGVPVAGLVSYQAWALTNIPSSEYTMSILNDKIATPTWLLLIAGFVMVVTLWTNAKSRKVTDTEVSLGRQEEGDEKFKSNFVSRALVGGAMFLGNAIYRIVPSGISKMLSVRFEKESLDQEKVLSSPDRPSFDLIRASINLLVSSALIAYGTSRKLPLSTTFVTFMVAMGTSFADQAWGRESAVFRVAGVMNVIAGWLITAVVALVASGLLAFVMYHTGFPGIIAITVVAAFQLIRSHVVFNKEAAEEKAANQLLENSSVTIQQVIDESKNNTAKNFKVVKKAVVTSIKSLLSESSSGLDKSKKEIEKLNVQNEKLHAKLIKYVRKMNKGNLAAGRLYIMVFDLMQDLYQSSQLVSEVSFDHVSNHLTPPKKKYAEMFQEIEKELGEYLDKILESVSTLSFANAAQVEERQVKLLAFINTCIDELIKDIQKDDVGNRMGLLQTRLFLEMKDIISIAHRVYVLYYDFSRQGLK
jgi:phosphate/sulfate permease